MSRRLKPYFLIIAVSLALALFLGPPFAIAKNLPTICNIFSKKMGDKTGSCGHRSMISKIQDKSFQVEAFLFFNAGVQTIDSFIISGDPTSFSFSLGSHTPFNPLRC